MNERELFEQEYREIQLIEKDGDTFEQYPNGDYVRYSLDIAWRMWQASANRQGYKLVPVSTLKEALSWSSIAKWDSPNSKTDEEIDKHTVIIENLLS